VYLIPTSYPVLVKLTRDLDFYNYIDRLLLARWTVALQHFLLETSRLLLVADTISNDGDFMMMLSTNVVFKPVRSSDGEYYHVSESDRSRRNKLDLQMHVNQLLDSIERSRSWYMSIRRSSLFRSAVRRRIAYHLPISPLPSSNSTHRSSLTMYCSIGSLILASRPFGQRNG